MKFDPNIALLFTEHPLLQRPAAVASVGFDSLESWWPFDVAVPPDNEVDAFVRAVRDANLTLACLNLDGGDFSKGDRGFVSIPAAQARFRDGIAVAMAIGAQLGCRRFNALFGNRLADLPPGRQEKVAIENLTLAVDAAAAIGGTIVIEALNETDLPAYGMHHIRDVLGFLDRFGAATGRQARVLFDIYHVARAGDDVIAAIESSSGRIGHVQLADLPGRGAPGTGSLAFGPIFAALEKAGYEGYVGLEYMPGGSSEASFGWLPVDRRRTDIEGVELW